MQKLTVLGDLMCEPSLLKAAKQKDGSYDFSGTFTELKPLLREADYVIANLEFPLAGPDAKYTDTFVEFNTPDEYVDAVIGAGIDLVSTINNHTLDRGREGMHRTLQVLDRKGLSHTGNFLPDTPREEAFYFTLGGVAFALIAYTYNTNQSLPAGDPDIHQMNLLHDMRLRTYTPDIYQKMNTWVEKVFPKLKEETHASIKKLLGMTPVVLRADDNMDMALITPYTEKMKQDIQLAKEKADYVIFYPHMGGQFNEEPGLFSKYIMEEATKAGADIVISSHSHLVQRAERINGTLCAYSIGNVTMCPNSSIIYKPCLPDYGIALHLYFAEKTLSKITFSILKGVEKKGQQLVSYPVDVLYSNLTKESDRELLKKDAEIIYRRFTGTCPDRFSILREYPLEL